MPGARSKAADEDVERTRMSIGEHLEELRTSLVRSLLALFVSCLLCIWPAKYLLNLIARPVIIVLRRHGQPTSFLQTSPVETFLIYIKVVIIFGLLVASPYATLWSSEAHLLVRLSVINLLRKFFLTPSE